MNLIRRVRRRILGALQLGRAVIAMLAVAAMVLLPGVHAHDHHAEAGQPIHARHHCGCEDSCGDDQAGDDECGVDHEDAPGDEESPCELCRLIAVLGTLNGSGLSVIEPRFVLEFNSLSELRRPDVGPMREADACRARGPPAI